MAFTFLMGTLLRPCLLITHGRSCGPGLPCADPSVNISMDFSEVPSSKLFMYSSVLSPSFGSIVVRFGMKKISWISEISGTICFKSVFFRDAWRVVYKMILSALVELFVSHFHSFKKSFIAFICCHFYNLRSVGAIFSLLSRASVGVDFIALRISFMDPL